jgi:hypothetical protein
MHFRAVREGGRSTIVMVVEGTSIELSCKTVVMQLDTLPEFFFLLKRTVA